MIKVNIDLTNLGRAPTQKKSVSMNELANQNHPNQIQNNQELIRLFMTHHRRMTHRIIFKSF